MADEPNVQQSSGGGASAPAVAPATSPGTQAPQTQTQQQTTGIDQLRTAYEQVKKDFEPYQKLNLQPSQISQYQTVYNRTFEQVGAIGRELGYPDDQIVEAIMEDPIATLRYLENEYAARQQGQQQQTQLSLQEQINQGIQNAVGPLQERENIRMTNEANALFERTVYNMAGQMYKAEGIDVSQVPEDEISLLTSAASEILKYDDDALRALKYEGKTAAIQKAFQEAKTMLDKYFVARMGRQGNRLAAGAPGGLQRGPNGQFQSQQSGNRKPTLDEIMDKPEIINPRYAERA
jgi:hypothetical protein